MSEHSYEHVMEPRSAVRRYYSDIRLARSEIEGLMAVQNLYESLPCESTESLEEILRGQNMPMEFEYDLDPRTAREKLALLPLRYFDEDIMHSSYPLAQAKKWYSEVVMYTVMLTKDDHGPACLDYGENANEHYMCSTSTDCPLRFLETALTYPATEYDFSERVYDDDPARMRGLIMHKLDIGKAFDILEENYVGAKKQQYDDALWQYLVEGPKKAEWGIQ